MQLWTFKKDGDILHRQLGRVNEEGWPSMPLSGRVGVITSGVFGGASSHTAP